MSSKGFMGLSKLSDRVHPGGEVSSHAYGEIKALEFRLEEAEARANAFKQELDEARTVMQRMAIDHASKAARIGAYLTLLTKELKGE